MTVQNIEQSDPEDHLGPRLRQLRGRAGLSQRELARRAGVTNATISQIETGRVSPSVASLRKIAGALGLSLAQFFAGEASALPGPFFRADQLTEIGSGGVSLRLVGAVAPGRELQMLVERYPPGADTGPEMLQHRGEECGVVLRGHIEVTVGDRTQTLGPGDAYAFDSTTPHRFPQHRRRSLRDRQRRDPRPRSDRPPTRATRCPRRPGE